jgi:LCP family protein required for cell wall assembly
MMIPERRWPRRLLVAANAAVAICLVSAGLVWGYVRFRIDSIRTLAAPHLTSQTENGSENILLIGNETRAGLTNPTEIAQLGSPQEFSGSLSDVIMVLHLDPAKGTASILSIPRDLFVPMPAGSPVGPYQKIDAALNDGSHGPDNLIEAITDDLGIPINHYVELEFDGFENTVNALGGINLDFPEPLFDANSLLSITTTGCVHLNGTEALALVRSRHLQYDPPGATSPRADWPYDPESDLSRIGRDQTFMRVLATTAESQGLTNPLKLNAFLGAIINQITIDPGLKSQLISLASRYRHLNPATSPELTLPVTTVGGSSGYYYNGVAMGDVDFPVQPADDQVIAQWDHSALPAAAAPQAINVYNLAGTTALAASTASQLHADGLPATVAGNQAVPSPTTETLVQYPSGGLAQALGVIHRLAGAVMLEPNPTLPARTITVEAGSLLQVTSPAAPAARTTPGATAASTRTTTAVPTPGGQQPSSASAQLQPWDPRSCPAK